MFRGGDSVAIPKYHEFMKPVLELLKYNQVHKRVDMYKVLAMQFQLRKNLKSGCQVVNNWFIKTE